MIKKHIVKRKGKTESFDERKIYTTCYAAAITASVKKRDAEKICNKVTKEIKKWIKSRESVTSNQIFHRVAIELARHNKNASFMYRTHRDIF